MSSFISEFELSLALSISTESVKLRAKKEMWPTRRKTTRGGNKRFYIFDLLPDDVKARVAEERNRRKP